MQKYIEMKLNHRVHTVSLVTWILSPVQNRVEVEVEEVEVVLEAAGRWRWEVFSREECQNYGQSEVK